MQSSMQLNRQRVTTRQCRTRLTRRMAPWPVRNCRCFVPEGQGDTMLSSTPSRPTTLTRPSLVPSCDSHTWGIKQRVNGGASVPVLGAASVSKLQVC